MSRPAFALSDDEARHLVQLVAPLIDRYPVDPRNHRPFTKAFLRAVHQVTHKTYGPDLYRRLMGAYAPGRSPSTSTLVLERRGLELELEAMAASTMVEQGRDDGAAAPSCASGPTTLPAAQISTLLRAALEDYLPRLARSSGSAPPATAQLAECDFLTVRLAEVERAHAELRTHAARLAGELQAQTALTLAYREQLATLQATSSAQAQALARLGDEVEAMRRHSMIAIDGVRGETRAARERCTQLEAALQEKDMMLESLRRTAFAAAAAPPRGPR